MADGPESSKAATTCGRSRPKRAGSRSGPAAGRRRVVVKGHRHRPGVWNVGPLTLVDAGSLLDDCETCAVIVHGRAGTITPLGIGPHGVYPGAPQCRFKTG